MASKSADTTSIPVRTTLPRKPLPPISERATIQTKRLLMRPLTQDDLEAYHSLRTQHAFMAESTLGIPDSSIAETQAALDSHINTLGSHFWFGIFIADTGELIGDGGIHTVYTGSMGWPEIGYKLHQPHWGRGYATESMSAVLKAWWQLPREEVEISIHPDTFEKKKEGEDGARLPQSVDREGGEEEKEKKAAPMMSQERVVANIATYNTASQRVLEKLGFEHFATWEEPDTQLHRLGEPLEMGHYVLSSPS
ncbi:acyl-CoA N-acyltransferase [Xylariaceae sp. AK1471]|nr:acyl-CoA N-acyltransferase [Xylariaceae sp. AK1471]